MGAFNEVRGELKCPKCRNTVETNVQFKFGSVAHYQYKIGDTLIWGANDNGTSGNSHVVLDGEGTACSICGYDDDWPVYIHVEKDVLSSIEPATGQYDFVSADESFLILHK